ncbi:MAG: Ycf66 family protein, partial [Cyanobacteria bacterium J06649_4]
MLANVLAVLLGISSFTFYMAAFFYPEVHRRSDFVWSGLGMFYALVLWFCAGQMTPTVQLGQLVAVALLLGLGWQTLSVRREKTPVLQQTPVVLTPEIVGGWAKSALNQLRIAPVETVRPQLQTRTLTSATTERLRQSLDPRRRPTYDYEFVEDGLPEVGESLEDLSLEPSTVDDAIAPTDFLATDFLLEETEAEPVEALTYTAPPSAVGEVLEEVTPQSAEPDRVDFTEVTEVEPTTVEPTTTAPLEDAKLEEQPVKKELVEEPVAEKLVEEDPLAEEPVDTDDAAADDWGDSDWLDDDTVGGDLPLEGLSHRTPETPQTPERTSERTPEKIPTQPEKPSLLAAPIILVGWVKDVVAS